MPTAYRRVGNYAVFVFDAPGAEAANQLIDQVKYQQVVQWLGQNPFAYEQATREFTETTLGVLVSVSANLGFSAGRLSGGWRTLWRAVVPFPAGPAAVPGSLC